LLSLLKSIRSACSEYLPTSYLKSTLKFNEQLCEGSITISGFEN
jgi:hypothetical protein